MANDFLVLDGAGGNLTKAATDLGGGIKADAVCTNARRDTGTQLLTAVTAVGKLGTVGTITLSGQTGGSLASATTYYVSAAAFNRWGNASPAIVVNTSPGGSNGTMRAAFAQVTGADGYDIFLSTDSGAPKWVGRITEAQRASGIVITAVGTTGAGGTAGAVDIQIPGTGLQTTTAPFTSNNAVTPASLTSVSCVGKSRAFVHVKLAPTDLRSLPSVTLLPMYQDQSSNTDWFADLPLTVSPLTQDGAPLEQQFVLDVSGATALALVPTAISGQGTQVSAWVELA